jgi:cysteine desulfurase
MGRMVPDDLVYLDHAATTPLDPRVLEAMTPYFLERFGNASSRQHALGREASGAVERAREQVARLIGADPREIVFTSGATESANLALKGVAHASAYERSPRRFVTAPTEHHAVLDPLETLAQEGFEVVRLAVDGEGRVDLAELEAVLAKGVRLVSLMHANNELGLLHPVAEIGTRCREHGALFHTDATQAVGKEPIDVDALKIDLLGLSAHKLGGPKGVGALYLRRRRPRVRCRALVDGGGHERGLRSGTLNVPGIVGLGAAAELCLAEMDAERERVAALRDHLEETLFQRLDGVLRNGPAEDRLAGTTNLSFAGVDAESLLDRMEGVAASSSSACTSASLQPSHVLRALGCSPERLAGSVRFSLGRTTTRAEVDRATDLVVAAVERERREGPRDACAT